MVTPEEYFSEIHQIAESIATKYCFEIYEQSKTKSSYPYNINDKLADLHEKYYVNKEEWGFNIKMMENWSYSINTALGNKLTIIQNHFRAHIEIDNA